MENANTIVFRSSGIGYLMAEPRNKTELLADTVKTNLIDIFLSAKYGRREEIKSKYLSKGNAREEDSITLLSRVTKIFFKKNETRLYNSFITGVPDLFTGELIHNAEETFDTKTSWSAHTFFRAKFAALNSMYEWQGQGYMWLTGAKQHTVAYCLVNGTADAIINEKRIASYEAGMLDRDGNETDVYIEKCKQIEINHIFDIEAFKKEYPYFEFHNDVNNWQWDIPFKDRVHTFTFKRDEEMIKRIQTRIRICRNWMNRELFNV